LTDIAVALLPPRLRPAALDNLLKFTDVRKSSTPFSTAEGLFSVFDKEIEYFESAA